MREPWEIFWDVCTAPGVGVATAKGRRVVDAAAAISAAAEATVKHLRNEREWTWVNSRILTGKLVDVATDWALRGGGRPAELRTALRGVWLEEEQVASSEARWRALTESMLNRGRGTGEGAAA